MRGHIRKRGDKWVVVIHLGRDPESGRKRDRWYTFATRREAETNLNQLLSQVQAGRGVPPTRLLVRDFLDQWVQDYAESHVAPATLRNYKDTIRVHLASQLGHVALSRLSPQLIERYLSKRQSQGRLNSTSLLYHYRILSEALGYAVRWGKLLRNPCDMVEPPKRRHVQVHVLDEEQTRLFLAEAKRTSTHYHLYLTAILTGMRQGELLGLRWRDVDLTLRTLSIQQTFYRLKKEELFKETKSERSRRPVSPPHVLHRRIGQDPRYADADLVFSQPNGKPLHGHNITQGDLRRVLRKAGLPRIRFHDLRHCHATHLLRQGVHPKVVQERLGHSSIGVTMDTYGHVLPGMDAEAARLVAEKLLGRPEQG